MRAVAVLGGNALLGAAHAGAGRPEPHTPAMAAGIADHVSRSAPREQRRPRGGRVTTDPALERLLLAADAAGNLDRIGFRDPIAAFGLTAVDPLIDRIAQGLHPHFAVAVLEAIGRTHPSEATAALRRAARLDPEVQAMATAAISRLGDWRPTVGAGTPRRSGVLFPASPSGPQEAVGQCEFLTKAGKPCQNPGRNWRDGRWSCSRNHPF